MDESSSFSRSTVSSGEGIWAPADHLTTFLVVPEEDRTGIDSEVEIRARQLFMASLRDHMSIETCFLGSVLIFVFWIFVSMILFMGLLRSNELQLCPYSSILLQPSQFFVKYMKVETKDGMKFGPTLYAFYNTPPLYAMTTSKSLRASLKHDSDEHWMYQLNKGSQIGISYKVSSSSSLVLVVAQGATGLASWHQDPTYPGNALSWNVIHGSGTITQGITKSDYYYVAVGNYNSENVEVNLNMSIRLSMYNTSDSYYKCTLTQGGLCSVRVHFPVGNAIVLTTQGPPEGNVSERLYVKVSYEPHWMTYILSIGGISTVMLCALYVSSRHRPNNEDENWGLRPEGPPLPSSKDDDLCSLGSSYDSDSQDNGDESVEYLEGEGGKKQENSKRFCVVCFDAPKDSFFIPCGHCATCLACGTRVAKSAGTCPICRRKIKKVKKIYKV